MTTIIPLEDQLSHWVELGLISGDQAEEIRVVEEQEHPSARATSVVTEALGYVGGALVVVASMLLASRLWPDLSEGGRLGLVAAGALLLLGVGFAVPAVEGTAGARLRSAVWALSTGAATFFVGLFVMDTLDWDEAKAAFTILAAASVHAGVLWLLSRAPVQQVVLFVALCGAAASGLILVAPEGPNWDGLAGVGVLVVAGAWMFLGLTQRLAPARVAELLGAVGLVLGAAVTQMADWGRVLSLVVLVGLITLALRLNQLLLLAVATLGMFIILPPVVIEWFPGALAAPLVLLGCGAALVLLALRAVRARER